MKTYLSLISLILISIVLFALTLRGVWGNPQPSDVKNNLDQVTKPLELSPERGRFLLTQNLNLNHSFALNQELADAAYPDVGYYKGNFFVQFAPGVSILALPFYNFGKAYNFSQLASFSVISLVTILNILLLYLVSKNILKLSRITSFFAPLIFAFATTSWSYAITLYQHQVTLFFILSSFYAVWKYRQKGLFSMFWATLAWLTYGLSFTVDYPNAIFLSPIMVYFLISSIKFKRVENKHKLSFRLTYFFAAIGFVLAVTWLAYYNNSNFGSPLRTSQTIPGYKLIKEGKFNTDQLDTNESKPAEALSGVFREDRIINGSYELLIATDKGVLIFSPILALGLLGLYLKRKSFTTQDAVLLSLVTVNFALYSSFTDPWGGWAFGPRYLIPSMAVLAMYVGVFLERTKYSLLSKALAIPLFAFSVGVALLGALTTNAVPPKVEADYLHTAYGFMFNWNFLMNNESGSFLYNTYFHQYLSLQEYFLYIFAFLVIVGTALIILIPNRRLASEH